MPKFKKGSQEAKDYMASIRKKKKGGDIASSLMAGLAGAMAHKAGEVAMNAPNIAMSYAQQHPDQVMSLAKRFAGGTVGAYEETVAEQQRDIRQGSRGSNMNDGIMVVPQAYSSIPIQVAGIAGRNGVPSMTGRGVGQVSSSSITSPTIQHQTDAHIKAYGEGIGRKGLLHGNGVINQLADTDYIGQLYDQRNLGANGYVRIK